MCPTPEEGDTRSLMRIQSAIQETPGRILSPHRLMRIQSAIQELMELLSPQELVELLSAIQETPARTLSLQELVSILSATIIPPPPPLQRQGAYRPRMTEVQYRGGSSPYLPVTVLQTASGISPTVVNHGQSVDSDVSE
jgi:hypothetical protein